MDRFWKIVLGLLPYLFESTSSSYFF